MGEDKVDYGEVFCEAVDTIIARRLDKLEFDVTKVCRVIDDTHKKQGKYTVTDNSVKFEAYSTLTTLNKNDSVLVNIPSGDYSNQKTILNKIVGNDASTSLNYKSPLSTLLKFTENIVEDNYRGEYSILANDGSEDEDAQVVTICRIQRSDLGEYEKMGVSVDVRTWLSHFHLTSGTYGLRFSFFTKDSEANKASYSFDLNINDMIGDPYGFNSYTKQEKVFNTQYVQNVDSLVISLYQQNNFIDEEGQYIPWQYSDAGLAGRKLNDNIFIKNLNIFFGSDVGEFTDDTIQISTPDTRSYSVIGTNEKTINLKWIHKVDDNTFEVLDAEKIRDKIVEIYWCRYILEAEESALVASWCGPNWSTKDSRLIESSLDNPFQRILRPDGTNTEEERIKVVCRIQDEYGEWHLYESKVLDFVNTSYVYDQKLVDKIAGLAIEFMDGSDGNYFIYNQNGEIINEGKGQGYLRKFVAKFDGINLWENAVTSRIGNIESVTWTLPADDETSSRGTMLTYKPIWHTGVEASNGSIVVTRTPSEGNTFATQCYSIKNNWHEANSNNTITCKVVAGGQIYTKTAELNFGKSGSSGTNITLKLDYDNDDNAFIIDNDGVASPCGITASMYDMSGQKITITEETGDWEWNWYHTSEDVSVQEYLTITNQENNKIQLTLSENYGNIIEEQGYYIPADNFHILYATFIPKATNTQITTNLTAFLPIAIKHIDSDYMEGTRSVVYKSDGTLTQSTYTDAYILYDVIGNEMPVHWELTWDNTAQDDDGEVVIPDSYGPSLKDLAKNGRSYKALKPSPLYVSGYNDRACVYAYTQEEGSSQKKILWSQPLLITQSQYDFAMVNEWSGGAQIGDNFIMATALGAGKKDPTTNTFSGIIIGDLKQAISTADGEESSTCYDKINTGLFGISKGVISFSLTDDGIATFGQMDSSGRAEFGGDTNVLIDKSQNTLLDIDNGIMNFVDNGIGLTISKFSTDGTNELPYLRFEDNGTSLIDFSKDNSLLQSKSARMKINLKDDKITLEKNATQSIELNHDDTVGLKVSVFTVNWDGSVSIGTKLRIDTEGNLYYNNKELTELIAELAK